MKWCMQCGALNRPEKAIGVDEDGEPACVLHRIRESIVTELTNAIVEPAAPSPLQATEQEKADMRTCSGFDGETCTEVLKEKNTSGMCTRHYARMMYRKSHPKKLGGGVAKKEKPHHPKSPNGGDQLGSGEHLITLQLSESKLARLVALLL